MEIEEEKQLPFEYACGYCGAEISPTVSFCSQCGKRNTVKTTKNQDTSDDPLISLFSYYFIIAFLLIIFSYPGLIADTFENLVIQDVIFSVITVVYGIIHFKELRKVYLNIRLEVKPLLIMVITVIAAAFIVNVLADYLNTLLGADTWGYMGLFEETSHPYLYAVLIICVQPAIFEEMAFRGFLFENMLKVGNVQVAMIVTSIVFGFMHFSLISLFWLVPLGYLFAYFRYKYKVIWYGVIGHFIYNLMILLLEF